MSQSEASNSSIYKEGILFKRPRGRSKTNQAVTTELKFQERFCRLTTTFLYYSKPNAKKKVQTSEKRKFPVENIRIVQVVEQGVFKKEADKHIFQVGDNEEIMYFATKTPSERSAWMEEFRKAASNHGNVMLEDYHPDVYSQGKWICCGEQEKSAKGCIHMDIVDGQHQGKAQLEEFHPSSKQLDMETSQSSTSTLTQKIKHSLSLTSTSSEDTITSSTTSSSTLVASRTEFEKISVQELSLPEPEAETVRQRSVTTDSGYKSSSAPTSRASSRLTVAGSKESLLSPQPINRRQSFPYAKESNSGGDESYTVFVRPQKARKEKENLVSVAEEDEYPEVLESHNQELPKSGEDPNMEDPATKSIACHLASREGSVEEVKLLLQSNADVNMINGSGSTPLIEASKNGCMETAELLLKHGAKVDQEGPQSRTALHEASAGGHKAVVELLLQHKADVVKKDGSGSTPLIEASKNGHVETAQLLIEHGAEVDQEGPESRTALHEASAGGHKAVVELLLQDEANVTTARDKNDATPYDLASQKRHHEVMELLQNHMPKSIRPYAAHRSYATSAAVDSLTFVGAAVLASGSQDCFCHIWDASNLTRKKAIKMPSEVTSVAVWEQYLAVGSTFVQLVDMSSQEWQKILIADTQSLLKPPKHLAAFTPEGQLVTASVENTTVKLWSKPLANSRVIRDPKAKIDLSVKSGCICSLSVSPDLERPWIAVGIQQLGREKVVKLYNWRTQKPLSRSHEMDIENRSTLQTVFSPDGRYLAIGCGETLRIQDINQGVLLYQNAVATHGTAISSLCYSPNGAHLSVGLSSGEVQVFETSSNAPIFTLRMPENPSAVTSMAYSSEGKLFAVGYQNGLLQVWKVHTEAGVKSDGASGIINSEGLESHAKSDGFLSITDASNKPLLTRTATLQFDSCGGKYESLHDGFSLVIPEGAIPPDQHITVECGVVPHGLFSPFEFPAGRKPVSAIVGFCSTPQIEFCKPVEIMLQHFSTLKGKKNQKLPHLIFAKADHHKNGGNAFHFEPVDGQSEFTPTSDIAKLQTKHFCYYCILADYTKEYTDQRSFCLTTVTPIQPTGDSWKVIFCLSYMLDTCTKTIQEQYGREYEFVHRKVTLTGRGVVKIKYPTHPGDGWIIANKSADKISSNEVCFWSHFKDTAELALAVELKTYPPRFILEIHGRNATDDTTAKIKFEGVHEDMRLRIPLIRQTARSHKAAVYGHSASAPVTIPEQQVHPVEETDQITSFSQVESFNSSSTCTSLHLQSHSWQLGLSPEVSPDIEGDQDNELPQQEVGRPPIRNGRPPQFLSHTT